MPANVACLDLDCFFVSVERLLDPSLAGKPVIVGHLGGRGVVTSCSYEVRPLGVRSGMPMSRALRLAPDAVVAASGFGHYSAWSAKVMDLARLACPEVQPASIDEAYLDFHGCARLYRQPQDADEHATIERVVRELRQRIQDELGLPASVGLGTTRAVAKMASSHAKPAGVFSVRHGDERDYVDLLPVKAFPGIGPVTSSKLVADGLHTLGQLLDLPPGPITSRWGPLSRRVANAIDPERPQRRRTARPAFREHDPEGGDAGSISNERTFHADVGDDAAVEEQLRALVERVVWRARKRGVTARTVGLKLRYSDFHTISRSRSRPPTCSESDVLHEVLALYRQARTRKLPIRLVGVQLSHLERPPPQLPLPWTREADVGAAIDAVRSRLGYDAVRLGAVGGSRWLADDAPVKPPRRTRPGGGPPR